MEIHAPEGPVHSVKDFLLHLSMITIGILIALALETAVEMMHHRALAREARENLASEIADNRKDLEDGLAKAPVARSELTTLINLIKAERTLRGSSKSQKHLDLGFGLLSLHSTSWETAQATGALSYMPYSEVKKFVGVYSLQQDFLRLQDQTFAKWVDLQKIGYSLDESVLSRFPESELTALQHEAAGTLSYTNAEIAIGQVLQKQYVIIAR